MWVQVGRGVRKGKHTEPGESVGEKEEEEKEEMQKMRKEESIYPAVKERKQGEWRRNEANRGWMGKGNEEREQREEGAKCRTDLNIGQSRRE